MCRFVESVIFVGETKRTCKHRPPIQLHGDVDYMHSLLVMHASYLLFGNVIFLICLLLFRIDTDEMMGAISIKEG